MDEIGAAIILAFIASGVSLFLAGVAVGIEVSRANTSGAPDPGSPQR
jgi:hypothetical protein